MAYQFQYVPTSGDLPGASFEKQTEQAINEIGARTDEIQDIAEGAVATAESALANALNAVETANSANTAAQEASAKAQDALNAATDAGNIASQARETANNAFDKAAQAETTANTAKESADQATSIATTAQETAGEALQVASNASGNANLAIQIANEARNVYTVEEEAVDADTMYLESSKMYAKNDTSTGFPLGITYPFYLDVSIASDFSSVTQIGWTETAPKIMHIRTAKVTPPASEEDPYTVDWSPWASVGGGGGVPVGFIGMWSGAVDQVPEGWLLCNGQNGTPNLRDRFIVGAGTTYAVGSTGGAASVTPAGSVSNTVAGGTVANTTLTTATMPSHNHACYQGYATFEAGQPGGNLGGGNNNLARYDTQWNGSSGAHAHGFTGTSHGHTFTGAALENRPPYYALAYIMKT